MLAIVMHLSRKVGHWLERKAGDGIAKRIIARLEKKNLYPLSAKCLTGAAVIMLAVVLLLLLVIIAELALLLQ